MSDHHAGVPAAPTACRWEVLVGPDEATAVAMAPVDDVRVALRLAYKANANPGRPPGAVWAQLRPLAPAAG